MMSNKTKSKCDFYIFVTYLYLYLNINRLDSSYYRYLIMLKYYV